MFHGVFVWFVTDFLIELFIKSFSNSMAGGEEASCIPKENMESPNLMVDVTVLEVLRATVRLTGGVTLISVELTNTLVGIEWCWVAHNVLC